MLTSSRRLGYASVTARYGRSFVSSVTRLGLVVVGWQLVVVFLKPSPVAVPSPTDVWRAFIQLFDVGFVGVPFVAHVGTTLERLAVGYAASIVVGVPTGVLLANMPFLRSTVTPLIALFRPVPSFSWLAVLVVWFSFGELTKFFVIFLVVAPIILLGSMDGVLRVPPIYRDAARSLGASRRATFWYVVLPAALPQILGTARVGLAISWAAVVAAELVGAQQGLGVIIIQSARFLRTDQTFAGLITLALLGAMTDLVMSRIERRAVGWARR